MKVNLKAIRYVAYAVEIILLAALQNTPNLMPELFGGRALPLLAAAVTFAAFEDRTAAAVLGAVCGAAADIASGGVGCYAVLTAAVCFLISLILETRLRNNFLTLSLLALGAVLLLITVRFLLVGLPSGSGWREYLVHRLPGAALTYLCVPPLYALNSFLRRTL